MADKPLTLVIGETNRDAALYQQLSPHISFLYAQNADDVIDLTSDDEPVDVCLISTADREAAVELCAWIKTDRELKHLPLAVVGEANGDLGSWLHAGAIDCFGLSEDPELLLTRLKSYSEMKHKNELLAALAHLDKLTALPSRQRMEEYLDIEWRRSLREFYPLSLIRLDIDRFTAYNDRYGIGRGDDVLKRLARAFEPLFNRAGDMLSRYGSDEYVVLLPSLELDSAIALAEKMVDTVSDLAIEHEGSEGGIVTASAGVAMIEPSRDKRHEDLEDEALEMLSRAQQLGGDQAQGIAV